MGTAVSRARLRYGRELLKEYPQWVKIRNELDNWIEGIVSSPGPSEAGKVMGPLPVPQQELLIERKESSRYYQTLCRDIERVERRRKAMASGKITAIWDDLESGWFMRIEDTTGDQIDEHLTLTEDEIENRELHDAVLNEEMDMALARNGREKKNYVKIILRGE